MKARVSEEGLPVPVVLASGSAERRRLLGELLPAFEVREPQVERKPGINGGSPESVAVRRAERKARDVAQDRQDALILAADTVVECEGEILGKPGDLDDARRMLRLLTSHPQRVITGVCLLTPARLRLDRVDAADIELREFSEAEIEDYVQNSDVCRWAGAYALQPDDPNVTRLDGDEDTVQGLPLERVEEGLSTLYPGWSA